MVPKRGTGARVQPRPAHGSPENVAEPEAYAGRVPHSTANLAHLGTPQRHSRRWNHGRPKHPDVFDVIAWAAFVLICIGILLVLMAGTWAAS